MFNQIVLRPHVSGVMYYINEPVYFYYGIIHAVHMYRASGFYTGDSKTKILYDCPADLLMKDSVL